MGHHGHMRAEDLDPIDERTIEVHEGHPVEVVLSLRLNSEESALLTEIAQQEGTDAAETMRLALRHYAASRTQRAAG